MAVGELEKKKRNRENGPLHWALVWAIALGLSLDQQMEVENGTIWAGIGPRLKKMGLGGAMGKWAVVVCSFAFEHSLMFWPSFFPKILDRCKVNFYRE